ncbi:transporter [Sphingobium subterraneum]|uniref:Opacity protein-like surface antigen n=1 Tax=Sphingobium subterraneum TaxID=627688 RepID=A0A841J056_9SPHN|nr:transporter [Sphingobium subterraneum]MBB6124599.1 opacity protein-like surface antigen [Sphingobium subterraneum]
MEQKLHVVALASVAVMACLPAIANAKDGSLTLSTGVSYSEGEYGDIEATKVFAVPVSLTYKNGPWKMRVSAPWVKIDGPASLIATPDGRGGSGSGSGSSNSGSGSGGSNVELEDGDRVIDDDVLTLTDNKRSGIGDASVSLTYSLDLGGDFYLEPSAKVKLPTASRKKRLGTGKVDVTLSGDLVKDIGDFSLYVHGRRKFAGKPEGSTIRSTWGTGGGASLNASEGVYVGADYDWQQSAFAGNKASSEITGWGSIGLTKNMRLTLYAITGLNSQSADFAGGASISYRF